MRARWTEADSRTFVARAALFVPARAEQLATLVGLVPAGRRDAFHAVELGAGDGSLARAILTRFPRCRYTALDGSAVMRRHLARRLAPFGARVAIAEFALARADWRRALPRRLRCVLASLVVHHLPGAGKRLLFADLARRIERGGALLLADLVAPPDPATRARWADEWDALVRAQCRAAHDGGRAALGVFARERWNFFRDRRPDPYDRPSPLADQLAWLCAAGFRRADCVWLRAGHAIIAALR